jgi:alpha-D-ribose 1-methylphosphonate 5-triphosphate diphosphatase
MSEYIFTNYRLQLPQSECLGTLVVRDGQIADIQPGAIALKRDRAGQDGQGNYLLPGFIELHTDNFEQRLSPRPKVCWPIDIAAVYHDRDVAAAGITTVCDAIALGDFSPTSLRTTQFQSMIAAIDYGQQQGRFTVDHYLHLRCELAYASVYDIAKIYSCHPRLRLISLMDHTPGQRQFTDINQYRAYYQGKYGIAAVEMDNLIQQRRNAQARNAAQNRRQLVSMAQTFNICLASHDDTTIAHVQESIQDGVAIAEFPTTVAAAQAFHRAGIQVLMGAPNLVLGGSHSGNISAMKLVEQQLVDIISSDYVPQSLLQALFLIAEHQSCPLHESILLFTLNPARAIGLESDRGSLEVGKRADLLTVQFDGRIPQLTSVWCQGRRIA